MTAPTAWTPGACAIRRIAAAAALAWVPPEGGLGIRLAYWALLLVHLGGRLPLLTLLGAASLWFREARPEIALGIAAVGVLATVSRRAWHDSPRAAYGSGMPMLVAAWWYALGGSGPPDRELALLVFGIVAVALLTRYPPAAWLGLLAFGLAQLGLGTAIPAETWILHALAFSPLWIPRRTDALPLTVYYDGECGFCHRGVQFLLGEDPAGAALRYAPLQGPSFAAAVPEAERGALPDSIVVRDAAGALSVRSDAGLRIGAALGGYWRPLAALGRLAPRALRDAVYDAIARRRKRWFAKPDGACPLLTPEQRERFDP